MEKKITNTEGMENNSDELIDTAAIVGPIAPITPITPIAYTIDTYTVNSAGTKSTGSVAYCDSDRRIHCNINITPGAKFKSIKRVFLLLSNRSGGTEGFSVHRAYSDTLVEAMKLAYVDNRYNSSGAISYRVIDITNQICGSKSQDIHIVIKSISGELLTVNAASSALEIEYLEDDDFIPNVSKLEGGVGKKGAYSVNTRNGKLFYTQNLIAAKGGRMPLGLNLTYNAADCDNSLPNGISTGIKGWTFNYAQTLKTSTTNYTLLDGAHMYRTFKPSTNNSAIRYDASGKSGLVLAKDSDGYYNITDGKSMTYTFDTDERLVSITSAGGATAVTTAITYNSDKMINTITDGMGDVYSFAYATNTITISRGTTALVELTLEEERLAKVKYLLSGKTYFFKYATSGELEMIAETGSFKKCVFTYSDAGEIIAVANYVFENKNPDEYSEGNVFADNTITHSTDSYHLSYYVLKTLVSKCRNSDSSAQKYSTDVYVFAENGETIFVCEDGTSGAFTSMRFRDKNDYEKYVANVISATEAERRTNAGKFTFSHQATSQHSTSSLTGTLVADSDNLDFNTFNFPSKNFVFTAKACIEASSYSKSDGTQSVNLVLKEGDTVLKTLKFDAGRRDYQVKSAMIYLPRGDHNLVAELQINNMYTTVNLSDVFIFETNRASHTEYITVFTDSFAEVENDGETSWYINRGGLTLTSGSVQETVKYTAKDYILTTISRLKNPSSFNVWYNDGEGMLAGVSSAYLVKGGVTQSIASIKCCTLTRQMGKIIFSTVEPSELDGGLIKTVNITKMQKEVEDANGNTTLEDEFFTSAVDYNSYMKPIEVTDEDGIVTEYTYNDFGEVLTEKTYPSSNTALNTLVSREYSGGNLSAVKEKRLTTEYTHAFAYNADDTLNYEVTPGGQYIYRSYTADREKISQIRATVSGNINSNDMTYAGDLLGTASHNNTTITFGYDDRNNVSNVNIAGVNIISKTTTYNSYGTTQVVTEYANGAKIKAYYDKYNRLIRVTDVTSTEAEICAYIYSDEEVADSVVDPMDGSLKISASSKLYAFIDTAAGKRTNYVYDEYGNLKETQTGTIKNTLIRDDFNRPERSIFYGPTSALQREVVYENDKTDRIASEKLSLGANFTHINYTRDALKRISEIKTVKDGNGYERKFAYLVRGNANSPEGTTNYVGSVSYYNVVNNVSTLEKSENIAYNADGNIITYGENTYVYDNLGRLIRENNKNLDKTFLFVYNVGGNIVSKTEYAYTTGTVGTATKTYTYTYGNTWKDQLTAFDGTTITCDAAGNPTSYLGKTLTWSRGRLLTKYVSGSKTVDIQYDGKGIRVAKTRKIGTAVTTNSTYIYDNGGKLRTEIEGNTTRNYIYGQDGVVGYEENGEHFMYRKNFFGDITAIYKSTQKVAEYVYDAWGNCTITYETNGYGSRNPFRYRGYYFDSDLGMYYLTTRYYDPQTGRFINADSIEYLKPEAINGLNLYTYCLNNPIMYVDPYGHDWKSFWEDVWNALVEIYMRALNVQMNNQIYQIEVTQTQVDIAKEIIVAVADSNLQANASQARFELEKSLVPVQVAIGVGEGVRRIVDEMTTGAPGYAKNVYLLPKSTFSSGTGAGAAGARHAGDLIFARFFGEDHIMEISK